jgi:hypothetical protein
MPFVDARDDLILVNKLTNLAEAPEDEDPSVIEIASALWRQENTIGSFVSQESGLPDGVDDQSFNPYDYFSEGEKLDSKFVSHAALADTVDEIEAVRKQYARETTDRETIQKGGATSFLVGLGVVGLADPINLIPIGGAVAKTYKAGNSILSAAVTTGSVATASTAVTEAALHQSQLTRTYGESAINLGAAALLGGVLGAGGKAIANSLDASAINGIVDSMDVEPKVKTGDDSVLSPEYRSTAEQRSVGASQRVADVEVSGKAAKGLVKALGFDPLSRTITSDNPFTRIVANRLAENPVKMDGDIVTAVESRAKIHDGKYATALQSHLDIYRQYRKNGGRLRKRQFNEEVARAMRNDESAIPEAMQSANNWRTELYNPIKDDLVELGLLPDDVSVSTAVSYLNRRWDKGRVTSNLPKFIDTTAKWLKDRDIELQAQRREGDVQPERRGDGSGRDQERVIATPEDKDTGPAPLSGAPIKTGATGPDAGITSSAERYSRNNGVPFFRQSEYVEVDENRARRIAQAFEDMEDNPSDPLVQEAYRDLIDQTRSQYDSLAEDGYEFTFFDATSDPYDGNPYNAIRDLRNNKRMSVYGTYDGYGTLDDFKADLADPNRIMLQDSGLRWKDQRGKEQIVTNNDLFRAVHDAFGHSLEGAGFRARGEENAFQAHMKMFTGPARRALTTETRGQNSWLNYGPYGSKNRTAGVSDTVFADQKMGLMPEWTSREGLIDELDIPDDAYYERIAEQIAQRITGTPDGRLPYDWKIGEGSKNNNLNGAVGLRGPLKSRTFQIPDNMVEEFLDNDIEDLGRFYLRNTATDMELIREFGDLDLTIQKKEILDWYTEKQRTAKTDKERIKLKKQADADIRDITAMRDRMRGVYAQPDPDNVWVRAGRVSRNLNYMRFMGGVVASSVPDVARIFMAEGIGKTFSKGLLPLARNINSFKVSSAEAKQYGVGVDALMGGRSQIIADVTDYTQPNTAFERGIQYATDNFGRVNLMDYWTTGVKQLHAVTMQNSVIDGLLKGKVDKRLARLGIDDGNAQAMAAELKKYATKVDGVYLSNARNWDSPELERLWGAAIRKESDRVIVVPGQEKPLFMSTELGKTIFQFRSFMFSSTQRMTIAALQSQDHNALAGVLMLTSLGMMSYSFKQWDAKREIAEDPVELVIEGIDRSGALGGIMEINNTLEKLSSNNFGMRPLLGVDIPAARFASRSMSENLLGPTFGSFLDTSLRVANAGLAEDGWNESDTRALRRLIPYQNLTFIRQAFDRIEKEVGDL